MVINQSNLEPKPTRNVVVVDESEIGVFKQVHVHLVPLNRIASPTFDIFQYLVIGYPITITQFCANIPEMFPVVIEFEGNCIV